VIRDSSDDIHKGLSSSLKEKLPCSYPHIGQLTALYEQRSDKNCRANENQNKKGKEPMCLLLNHHHSQACEILVCTEHSLRCSLFVIKVKSIQKNCTAIPVRPSLWWRSCWIVSPDFVEWTPRGQKLLFSLNNDPKIPHFLLSWLLIDVTSTGCLCRLNVISKLFLH
jgi:hypothetical protein